MIRSRKQNINKAVWCLNVLSVSLKVGGLYYETSHVDSSGEKENPYMQTHATTLIKQNVLFFSNHGSVNPSVIVHPFSVRYRALHFSLTVLLRLLPPSDAHQLDDVHQRGHGSPQS